MTDKKISELTEVTSPAGSDVLPIVSGGDTKKVTVDNLLAEVTPFDGGTITQPLIIDVAATNIARLQVLDSNDRPMFGVAQSSFLEPTYLDVPTLHADEHGVNVVLDGLSAGFIVQDRSALGLFSVSGTGQAQITPTDALGGDPLVVYNAAGTVLFAIGEWGAVFNNASGVVLMRNLPSTDPLVAGALFSDGVPSAGNPMTLKVSGG